MRFRLNSQYIMRRLMLNLTEEDMKKPAFIQYQYNSTTNSYNATLYVDDPSLIQEILEYGTPTITRQGNSSYYTWTWNNFTIANKKLVEFAKQHDVYMYYSVDDSFTMTNQTSNSYATSSPYNGIRTNVSLHIVFPSQKETTCYIVAAAPYRSESGNYDEVNAYNLHKANITYQPFTGSIFDT